VAATALAVLLIGGQEIAMIFADVRLPGAMDGIDLAWMSNDEAAN
jgi:DNA-binding LytR/AlgR family response regulator